MSKSSRRKFLQSSAFIGASAFAVPLVFSFADPADSKSPNERVRVAGIGAMGKGESGIAGLAGAGAEIVALCDVDLNSVKKAGAKYPKAKTYQDWRKVYDDQKDFDAVIVSTPDHNHAICSVNAMKLGKHCYCEKPLAHSIGEVRQMMAIAKANKLATQMGNQGHADSHLRLTVDWLRAGIVGAVKEAHVWTNRPKGWWPQGMKEQATQMPVPKNLDWDVWVGPAPMRFYNSAYLPFKWRGWWDFGTGALGDMACHVMDTTFWAFDLTGDCTIETQSEGGTEQSPPVWSIITYSFPATDKRPAMKLIWYDGGKRPPKPEEVTDDAWAKADGGGTVYIGEKGNMYAPHQGTPMLLGDLAKQKIERPKPVLPISKGHHEEFIAACKGGVPALSNFTYSGPLAEMVLLGNLALRSGKKIEWSSAQMKAANAPECDQWIKPEFRKGWSM